MRGLTQTVIHCIMKARKSIDFLSRERLWDIINQLEKCISIADKRERERQQ